jgi:hypothetical protein
MTRISISYRHADTAAITGRIVDRLAMYYGRESISYDIDNIPFGFDLSHHIREIVRNSDIVIAVVGPHWTGPQPGRQRITYESDPVRVEIETGLREGIPVIPVLVRGTRMPHAAELPDSLRDFAYRTAAQIDPGQNFHTDMSRLIRDIDRRLMERAEEAPPVSSAMHPDAILVPRPLSSGGLSLDELLERRRAATVYPTARRRRTVTRDPRLGNDFERPGDDFSLSSAAVERVTASEETRGRRGNRGESRKQHQLRSPEEPRGRPQYADTRIAPAALGAGRRQLGRLAVLTLAAAVVVGAVAFRREIAAAISAIGELLRAKVSLLPGHLGTEANALPLLAAPAMLGSTQGGETADLVEISAFAPEAGGIGGQVLVQALLHALADADAAEARARAADPSAVPRATTTLATDIARGKRVDMLLEAGELAVDEPAQSVVWWGRPSACQFLVTIPPGTLAGTRHLRITVLLDRIPIGTLRFALKIAALLSEPEMMSRIAPGAAKHYEYAFLSYASPDRVRVLQCAQMLNLLGIDFFHDVLRLPPGKEYEERIFAAIDRCDLFLLFWSTSAARSEWVQREAARAFARRQGSAEETPEITPYLLEGPPVPQPIPAFLSHLHFNDYLRYFITAAEIERSATAPPPHSPPP